MAIPRDYDLPVTQAEYDALIASDGVARKIVSDSQYQITPRDREIRKRGEEAMRTARARYDAWHSRWEQASTDEERAAVEAQMAHEEASLRKYRVRTSKVRKSNYSRARFAKLNYDEFRAMGYSYGKRAQSRGIRRIVDDKEYSKALSVRLSGYGVNWTDTAGSKANKVADEAWANGWHDAMFEEVENPPKFAVGDAVAWNIGTRRVRGSVARVNRLAKPEPEYLVDLADGTNGQRRLTIPESHLVKMSRARFSVSETPEFKELDPHEQKQVLEYGYGIYEVTLKMPDVGMNIYRIVAAKSKADAVKYGRIIAKTNGYKVAAIEAKSVHSRTRSNKTQAARTGRGSDMASKNGAKAKFGNGENNRRLLQVLGNADYQIANKVVQNIKSHYGISDMAVYDELFSDDAEHLLDYVTEPVRSAAAVILKRKGMMSRSGAKVNMGGSRVAPTFTTTSGGGTWTTQIVGNKFREFFHKNGLVGSVYENSNNAAEFVALDGPSGREIARGSRAECKAAVEKLAMSRPGAKAKMSANRLPGYLLPEHYRNLALRLLESADLDPEWSGNELVVPTNQYRKAKSMLKNYAGDAETKRVLGEIAEQNLLNTGRFSRSGAKSAYGVEQNSGKYTLILTDVPNAPKRTFNTLREARNYHDAHDRGLAARILSPDLGIAAEKSWGGEWEVYFSRSGAKARFGRSLVASKGNKRVYLSGPDGNGNFNTYLVQVVNTGVPNEKPQEDLVEMKSFATEARARSAAQKMLSSRPGGKAAFAANDVDLWNYFASLDFNYVKQGENGVAMYERLAKKALTMPDFTPPARQGQGPSLHQMAKQALADVAKYRQAVSRYKNRAPWDTYGRPGDKTTNAAESLFRVRIGSSTVSAQEFMEYAKRFVPGVGRNDFLADVIEKVNEAMKRRGETTRATLLMRGQDFSRPGDKTTNKEPDMNRIEMSRPGAKDAFSLGQAAAASGIDRPENDEALRELVKKVGGEETVRLFARWDEGRKAAMGGKSTHAAEVIQKLSNGWVIEREGGVLYLAKGAEAIPVPSVEKAIELHKASSEGRLVRRTGGFMSRPGAKARFSVEHRIDILRQKVQTYLAKGGSWEGLDKPEGLSGLVRDIVNGRTRMTDAGMDAVESRLRKYHGMNFSRPGAKAKFANWTVTPTKKNGVPINEHTAKIGKDHWKIDELPSAGKNIGQLYRWDDLRGLRHISTGDIEMLKKQAEAVSSKKDAISDLLRGFSRPGAKAAFSALELQNLIAPLRTADAQKNTRQMDILLRRVIAICKAGAVEFPRAAWAYEDAKEWAMESLRNLQSDGDSSLGHGDAARNLDNAVGRLMSAGRMSRPGAKA